MKFAPDSAPQLTATAPTNLSIFASSQINRVMGAMKAITVKNPAPRAAIPAAAR